MIAEGVHANRIKWNAYALRESLAVPEVSDEFKEFAETYADKLFELGLLKPERSMVHDTTKNFPFLNQIGYRLGGNPMYCAFARGWLEERRQLRMSFTDYDGLARAADLAAYMWLAAQPAVNLRTREGWTVMHWAAEKGATEVMWRLLRSGAVVNAQDQAGRTALMLAARRGHLTTVRLLLERGALRDVEDFDGQTALDWAEASGRSEITELLLR